MALTENTFTAAELEGALTANPDLLKEVLPTLQNRKFIVQDEETHNNFKSTFERDVASRKTSEHAKKLEEDVLALTGIPKIDANEKYYDYFKRATTEKLALTNKLQADLEDLKSKSNPSEADKARIKQLEAGIAEKETALQNAIKEKNGEIQTLKVGNQLSVALASLRAKYRADLPADVIATMEQVAIDKLTRQARIQEDGTLTFVNDAGEVIQNTATYKALTAEEMLSETMKSVIDEGRKAEGAGSTEGSAGKTGGEGSKQFTGVPADVKTKVDFTAHLQKLGILQGSKEFDELFDKHAKALPTR